MMQPSCELLKAISKADTSRQGTGFPPVQITSIQALPYTKLRQCLIKTTLSNKKETTCINVLLQLYLIQVRLKSHTVRMYKEL